MSVATNRRAQEWGDDQLTVAKKGGENIFSVNVDAVFQRICEEDRVSSFGRVQNRVQISRFRRNEMISERTKGR